MLVLVDLKTKTLARFLAKFGVSEGGTQLEEMH